MTTLADITLGVIKIVNPENVVDGYATLGSNTYLKDIERLVQPNEYFNRGTLWIRSGAHAGKVALISGHIANQLNFLPLSSVLCTPQVETATVAGTCSGSGNATVIVTAAIMGGLSPKTFSVAVLNLDSASAIATKIRAALNASTDITNYFTVGGSGVYVTLTSIDALANDTTLNISIANDTCTGITAAASSANTTAGIAGPQYSAARSLYPWHQIVSSVWEALQVRHAYVLATNAALVGDGETLSFALPALVSDIKSVRTYATDDLNYKPWNSHWREQGANLIFDAGHAVYDDWLVELEYRTRHADLTSYATVINNEINEEWLKYKASEILLLWGVGAFQASNQNRIEERLNMVMERLKTLQPRFDLPDIRIHTSG